MRLLILGLLATTPAAAQTLTIPFPAPLSTIPICIETEGEQIDVVYELAMPDIARIEVWTGTADELPAWQVTPVGLTPGGSLTGHGGMTAMHFDPPLAGPVELASALVTGPGLGDGPEGVTMVAYGSDGSETPGPAFTFVQGDGCP